MDSPESIEEWCPVPGWPYEVSSHGRVRRTEPGPKGALVGRILKPGRDDYGYACLCLSRVGEGGWERWDCRVHVLVCQAWRGPRPFPKAQVRHLDGDCRNDTPTNLEWGTAVENAADRERHGRAPRGERHGAALLTKVDVERLRAEHAAARAGRGRVPPGWLDRAAERYGVGKGTLAAVTGGWNW